MISRKLFKQKLLIIQDIDGWNLLLALFLKFLGAQVYYMNLIFSSKPDVWMKRLAIIGIHRFGCEVLSPDGRMVADAQKVALEASEKVLKKIQKHNFHRDLLYKMGGKKFKNECNILIKKNIYRFSYPIAELIIFSKAYEEKNSIIPIIVCDNNMISQTLLKKENIKNIEPRFYTVFRYSSRVILGVIVRLCSRLFYKIKKVNSNDSKEIKSIVAQSKFDIVYFPHKGIDYGQMFIKDQYYFKKDDHPLHPKNILHLSLKDEQSMLKFSLNYYKEKSIPNADYYAYRGTRIKEKFLLIQWFIINCFKTSVWKNLDLLTIVLYLYTLLAVADHKTRLKNIGVKIILVGYDYLFPVSISLAARINDIVSVATQERYLLAYMNPFYVFDYYFSIGKPATVTLSQNQNVSIGKIYTIGSVRKDLLIKEINSLENKTSEQYYAKEKKNVLILDFHTEKSRYQATGRGLNNIKNNRQFYKMIIEIAKKYPDLNFMIKGKNADFIDIEEFKDIVTDIEESVNLTVLTDYRYWTPYRAAAESDFAIALHTSLGDEMLQAGKPVIFYDPTILRFPSGFTDLYNDVLVKTIDGLCDRIDELLKGEMDRYHKVSKQLYFETESSVIACLHKHLSEILEASLSIK